MTEQGKVLAIVGSGAAGHVLAGEMAERVKAVVHEYAGRVPTALAIGVLEIVKAEILAEQVE